MNIIVGELNPDQSRHRDGNDCCGLDGDVGEREGGQVDKRVEVNYWNKDSSPQVDSHVCDYGDGLVGGWANT